MRACARPLTLAALLAAAPALLAAIPAPALAASGEENLAAGLKKFDEGRKAYEAGQFEAALVAFEASLELLPSPNTRLYIGRCYRALGKTASAYTSLKLAAREAQDRLTASGEKRYTATRDTASQEAADLEPKVPWLTVAVPSNPPPGFAVKVDHKELPQAAWGVSTETDPGDVVVEATGPRLVPFEKTVTLKEGSRERVDVPLARVPTATLAVKLEALPAGLALTLDGQPIEVTGVEAPREIDVGEHTLAATAPGYLPFKWTKSLADAEAQVVDVKLAPRPQAAAGPGGTPRWLFFGVAGAAVVAAGVGAGVAVHAEGQQSAQEALPADARDAAVKASIQSQAVWTDVLFAGSGVLAAGALVLAFTTRWHTAEAPQAGVSVAPWVGAGAGGVGANGRF